MGHKGHRQRKLSSWINPNRFFLKKDIINRLRELDLYEKDNKERS